MTTLLKDITRTLRITSFFFLNFTNKLSIKKNKKKKKNKQRKTQRSTPNTHVREQIA